MDREKQSGHETTYLSVVQNYTRVTPQRQAQLKERHHPGFQPEYLREKKDETKLFSTVNQTEDVFQGQRYQQEIRELRENFLQEIRDLKQERRENQRQIADLLKQQQQLLQLLTQKST
ncbi:MAG: hypothetical protein ACFFBD_18835 [Candidatus Hodarchaeota archaeon]